MGCLHAIVDPGVAVPKSRAASSSLWIRGKTLRPESRAAFYGPARPGMLYSEMVQLDQGCCILKWSSLTRDAVSSEAGLLLSGAPAFALDPGGVPVRGETSPELRG